MKKGKYDLVVKAFGKEDFNSEVNIMGNSNVDIKFNDLVKPIPKNNEPIATRVVTPKPVVTNGAKASAASTTRSVTTPAKQLVNPLAMSDEDFLKQMNNRV